MKARNLLLLGLIFGLIFTSCKKDKDQSELEKFDSEYSQFSENSVETNKSNLEDQGIELVNELTTLKESEAGDVMMSFSDFESGTVTKSLKPLAVLSLFNKEGVTPTEVFNSMKSAMEDPSLTDEWNDLVGKYTWNPAINDWDESALSDAIHFVFPGKDGDQTNTASILINNFGVAKITNPREKLDLDTDELPTSITAVLSYKDVELAKYTFTASYMDDGMPTSVKTELKVDAFSLSAEINHSAYNSMSTKESFKNGGKILLETSMGMTGNWSDEKVKLLEDWDNESGEIPPVNEILNSANASVQVMNIKIAGLINADAIIKDLKAFNSTIDDNTSEKEFNDKMVEIMNNHGKLVVVYADSKEIIAKAEFYMDEDEYGNSEPDMRFVFADGSNSDIDTYFEKGFVDLEKKLDELIADFE